MILINGRFLTQELTGVQRYATEITKALSAIRGDLIIAAPLGCVSQWNGVPVVSTGRFRGHVWEQIELPNIADRFGNPLLLSLTSTGPLRYRRQIVTHHDITYVRHPESFRSSFRWAYRIAVPRLLRKALKVITVSEFSKREIAEHYSIEAAKIEVIPNAVGLERADCAPRNPSIRPYFLAVSSLAAHKNYSMLLDAFARADVPGFDLRIVGTRSSLRSDFVHAASPRVIYEGRVSDSRLVELYAGAEAFVFPSLYEGFGIPPLEAQACGCPVLCSDIPATREVLGSSAVYFDPKQPGMLAELMKRVAEGEMDRSSLIRMGSSNSERYSWIRSAARLCELLDAIQQRRT